MVREWFTLETFRRSGVETTKRPFQLTMDEFASLCDVYAEVCFFVVMNYDFSVQCICKQ